MRILFLILIFNASEAAFAKACGSFVMVNGTVEVKKHKTKSFIMAHQGDKVCSGDFINTGEKSKTKVVMEDTNEFVLGANSGLRIKYYRPKKKKVLMELSKGKIRNLVKQKYAKSGQYFRVKTSSAVAGVRGTDFVTEVSEDGRQTEVMTFEGEVAAFDMDKDGKMGKEPMMVKPGFKMMVKMGEAMKKPKRMAKREMRKMENDMNMEVPPAPSTGGPMMLELKEDAPSPEGQKGQPKPKEGARESFHKMEGGSGPGGEARGREGDQSGHKHKRRKRKPKPKGPPPPPPGG